MLELPHSCTRPLIKSTRLSWWRRQMETFLHYSPFVRGIHWSPVNSPHKGQWRGALMFSSICASINAWVYNREAGDLRHHYTHYDIIVIMQSSPSQCLTWVSHPGSDVAPWWLLLPWSIGSGVAETHARHSGTEPFVLGRWSHHGGWPPPSEDLEWDQLRKQQFISCVCPYRNWPIFFRTKLVSWLQIF